jgi:hypothetical protein
MMTEGKETTTNDNESTRPNHPIPRALVPYVTTYAVLRAQGKSQAAAIRAIGKETATATRWEKAPWWPGALATAHATLLKPLNVEQALAPHVPRALERMLSVLESDSAEQVRMAAQWILERYYGKAISQTQSTTHTTHHIDVGNAVRVLREAQQRALPEGAIDVDFSVVDDEESNDV